MKGYVIVGSISGVSHPVPPSDVAPSGEFDDTTSAALISFQRSVSIPDSEIGFVSVNTMEQFDLMLGIAACSSYGLGRLTDAQVTSEISAGASDVLQKYWNFPIGTEIPFAADGKIYIGRIELHYHEYGGSMTPYGYHHGVSVFYFERDELMTGSEFMLFTESMTVAQREDYILLELARGNILQSVFKNWQTITVTSTTISHNVTIKVLPDYLSIGSDADFIRVPCAAYTAQKLADLFGTSVPTTKLVDTIWAQAKNKVEPQPISPSDLMCRNAYITHENSLIERQLKDIDVFDRFIGGDKKDTVLTNQYETHPNSVAEYGWHQLNGEPIQPLYLGHSCDWADYSMGIRMISNEVIIDNEIKSTLTKVLVDENLAPIVSEEGVIRTPRLPINPRPAADC